MRVDVREQEMETLFVTEKLAFGVSVDLLEYPIEDEVKELCQILATIRRKAGSPAVKDLVSDVNATVQAYDDPSGKTM
jgi:hypothetical protein